jgi:methionyl-tRNA synthetase
MLLDQLGVDESRRSLGYCGVGLDLEYGIPMIALGSGHVGALFPPLCE